MKRILVFLLSLLSAVTFSLSACSSNKDIFKKVEIYGYGYNETFFDKEWDDYNASFLVICCIFQDDYFINDKYGIQYVYEEDLEDYKSVKDYLSKNKNITEKATPSNRQITISQIGYGISHHLKYIALYDYIITSDATARTETLIDIIEISESKVIYKQIEKSSL